MSSNCTSTGPVSASKTKTKKKHFIGQKVKLFRASEPILSVLMWGVNHTVKRQLTCILHTPHSYMLTFALAKVDAYCVRM